MDFIIMTESMDNRDIMVQVNQIKLVRYHAPNKTKVICHPGSIDMSLNFFVTQSVDEIYSLIEEEKRRCF